MVCADTIGKEMQKANYESYFSQPESDIDSGFSLLLPKEKSDFCALDVLYGTVPFSKLSMIPSFPNDLLKLYRRPIPLLGNMIAGFADFFSIAIRNAIRNAIVNYPVTADCRPNWRMEFHTKPVEPLKKL